MIFGHYLEWQKLEFGQKNFVKLIYSGFQTMLNPTHIYTVKKGCENRIFGFPQKYHVKTTQDTTQVTFRVFQAKLGPVNF